MATLTANDVRERLTEIDRRRRELWKRQSEVKDKRDLEQNRLLTDEANRKGNLELLAGAEDDAMAAYLQNEVDELDKRIAAHRRMIEAYNGAVAKIDAELKIVTDQLTALNKEVEANERALELEAWTGHYERAAKEALEALDTARVKLAVLAATGRRCDEFDKSGSFQGSRVRDLILENFFRLAVPGTRGFQIVHGPRSGEMRFDVFPSARKTDLPGLL